METAPVHAVRALHTERVILICMTKSPDTPASSIGASVAVKFVVKLGEAIVTRRCQFRDAGLDRRTNACVQKTGYRSAC
jgi:hypothetical protein